MRCLARSKPDKANPSTYLASGNYVVRQFRESCVGILLALQVGGNNWDVELSNAFRDQEEIVKVWRLDIGSAFLAWL